jgi:GT2 family glycosyltransferase
MRPKVTAVIVNWNRKNDVIALLDTVSCLGYHPLRIIVVDNASADDSVAAIKAHPLEVILIENPINLGGTGGFNTGVRYALNNLEQDYIWLLDNDATVDSEALAALVDVMEQDQSIAIAGSKILNAHRPSYIVETGAHIDWRTASVLPVNRNVANPGNGPALFDVEYVAICSALFRVSALKQVGVMDERYFLLWDDMDWGVSFRQAGYRVVAVNHSVIYHPPFTEKRSLAVDNYYGIRNSLLTASKRTSGILRCLAVLKLCRCACRIFCLAALDRQYYTMQLSRQALVDFLCNRWGKLSLLPASSPSVESVDAPLVPWPTLKGKILVLNSGPVEVINHVLSLLAGNCGDAVTIDVVLEADRHGLLDTAKLAKVIKVDFVSRDSLLRNFRIYLFLRKQHYSLAINPSADKISPFAYAAPRLVRFEHVTDRLLSQQSHCMLSVVFAVISSELAAILLFPSLYLRSLYYSRT